MYACGLQGSIWNRMLYDLLIVDNTQGVREMYRSDSEMSLLVPHMD